MTGINTNINTLVVQNNALKSSSVLQQSIERLSSGMRINSAKDDAAGQAIANRMGSQIRGLIQASRNASDGRSMAETAEGALSEVNQRLQRIRELSVQSLSGTYSLEDADSIQAEINTNLKEIARLNSQTTFNGKNVLDGSAGSIPIQVGVNDKETLGLFLGKPGFSVDELGLTDLVIRGISGKVTATDQLVGSASNISLSDASTSLTFNTGSTLTSATLVRSSGGQLYIQGTDAQGKNTYLAANYGASYNTATEASSVTVSASSMTPLYGSVATLPSRTVSGLTFVDNTDVPISADALVNSNGKFYIQQGSDYFEADLRWGPTGAMQAKVSIPVAQTALTAPVNVGTTPAVDFISSMPSFVDSSGAAVSNPARLVKNGSQYFMEVDNGGGDFSYFAASISVTSDGGTPSVIVKANTATAQPAFSEVTTVSGTSYVTIDPDKMQLNYTDNDGQTFSNVLARDADGNYMMNLGADGKTATLVQQTDGSLLIKTLNGSGDVQIYYPNSYSASTDVGTGRTIINLREAGDGIRLRNPDNPLATLDAAIARVDQRRSQLGATMNRLDSVQNVQTATSTALSTSRSRIEDADYAQEVSQLSKAQILQQAGNSVLAKSNQQPQAVLSLLQG
jgi:flagellin